MINLECWKSPDNYCLSFNDSEPPIDCNSEELGQLRIALEKIQAQQLPKELPIGGTLYLSFAIKDDNKNGKT